MAGTAVLGMRVYLSWADSGICNVMLKRIFSARKRPGQRSGRREGSAVSYIAGTVIRRIGGFCAAWLSAKNSCINI